MGNQWVQAVIVGVIVLCAVVYLLRKYLPRRSKSGDKRKSCGNCGSCSGDGGGGCH